MGGKVRLRCKGKTLLGIVNESLKTKSMLTSPNKFIFGIVNIFFDGLSEKIHFTGRKNTQHLSMTNTVEGERKQARNLCNVMAWLHALKDVIWEKFNALPF